MGHLTTIFPSISVVELTNSASRIISNQTVFGNQLSNCKKQQSSSLIFKHQDVFVSNP